MLRASWLLPLALCAACGDDASPFDAARYDAEIPNGSLSLTWSITDDGVDKTCTQIGATTVTLSIVPDDQPFGTTDVLSCTSGSGTIDDIVPGRYDVTVTMAGTAGMLGDEVSFPDVDVAPDADTPLGNAAFEVDAEGGFAFQVVAGGTGNCTPAGSGGAGIDAMQFELEDQLGTCVEATFQIAAGASLPASEYTTSCTAPAPHVCVAQDQEISVAPTMPSGQYTMQITGFIGGLACWSRNPLFNIPAGGNVTQLPDQNLNQTGTVGCPM
jgi:hypothetical protein